jgi:hypothetical protein
MWRVEVLPEWERWMLSLSPDAQAALAHDVRMLAMQGPFLARPHADTVRGSRFSNMKELRTMHAGRQYRTFFAFDPRRCGVVLVGGDKSGDERFYRRMIDDADMLFARHLARLEKGDPHA